LVDTRSRFSEAELEQLIELLALAADVPGIIGMKGLREVITKRLPAS
jgi:hypothetical protein